jgi:uncharacterized membrane protein
VIPTDTNPSTHDPPVPRRKGLGFSEDFRRFFLRGLATLLPTIVTLWLLLWVWNFLWNSMGYYIILGLQKLWDGSSYAGVLPVKTHPAIIDFLWHPEWLFTRFVGVMLSMVLVYIIGVLVGNFIGRSMWRLAEVGVLRIPLVRAIYPAVKQVTDFVLAERSTQFQESRVVAVQPHEKGIWSIGLVTGGGLRALSDATGQEMVTVFVPSSPTAFSGYVLVVPRSEVVELPLKVDQAMRLLVSGGVLSAGDEKTLIISPPTESAPGPKIPVPSSQS